MRIQLTNPIPFVQTTGVTGSLAAVRENRINGGHPSITPQGDDPLFGTGSSWSAGGGGAVGGHNNRNGPSGPGSATNPMYANDLNNRRGHPVPGTDPDNRQGHGEPRPRYCWRCIANHWVRMLIG